MTTFKYTNFAETVLDDHLDDEATVLRVPPSESVRFPVLGADEKFAATIEDGAQEPEIVYATANPLDGSFVVERAREGTSAKTWLAGSLVYLSLTAGTLGMVAGPVPGTDLTGVWAAIEQEVTLRETLGSAFAQFQTSIQAQVNDNAALLLETRTAFTDLNSAMAEFQTNITARVETAEASVTSTQTALVEFQQAMAASLTLIEADIDGAYAGIEEEATARAQADEAQATINTSVNVSLGNLSSAITSETNARIGADGALASQIDTLEVSVGANTAAIATETQARADEDTALAGQITSVNVSVANLSGALTIEQGVRADADEVLASRSTVLESQMAGTQSSGLFSRITNEETARTTGDATLAASVSTLTSTVNGNFTNLTSSINNEAATRASADSTLAARSTTFESQMADTIPSGLRARIITEESTRASVVSALSTRSSTLEAQMANTASSGLQARIANEETARVSGDSALATSVSSLSTTVSGHTATLSDYGSSIGGLQLRRGVRLDVDGAMIGWELFNNSGFGGMDIRVNTLTIRPPTGAGSVAPFAFDPGLGIFTLPNIRVTSSINVNDRFIVAADGTTTIQSATSGERTVYTSQRMEVYNAANVKVVELGILS